MSTAKIKFPPNHKFDTTKPLRLSIYAPFTALSQISSERFPTEPEAWDCRYTAHPGAISLALQTYMHFFGPITLEQFIPLIRHGAFHSPEKLEDSPLKIGDPIAWPPFDAYSIVFDYEGANGFVGEEDPEAVGIYVDEGLGVKVKKFAELSRSIKSAVEGSGTPKTYTGRRG